MAHLRWTLVEARSRFLVCGVLVALSLVTTDSAHLPLRGRVATAPWRTKTVSGSWVISWR